MQTKSKQFEIIPVLELEGRFDAYTTGQVTEWVKNNVNKDEVHLIIDMAGVNFIDSTALAALLGSLKQCRQRQGNLVLCSLQQPVQIIFELTRLTKAFDILPDQVAAYTTLGEESRQF